jgi:fibronectin-binding autotransporter adhesin
MANHSIKHLAASLLAASALLSAHASSLYWDALLTGSNAGGGTGTWNLSANANWYNGTADIQWTDSSALGTDSAIFPGTAGTVTLNTSLSASNLQFTTTGYTLTGSGTVTDGPGGIDASALTSGTTTVGVNLALPALQRQWQVGSGGTLAINGAVTRSVGATVDFSSVGVTSTTLANDANGIIDGWATTGNYVTSATTGDFLSVSNGNIIICTNYLPVSPAGSTTLSATVANSNLVSGALNGATKSAR